MSIRRFCAVALTLSAFAFVASASFAETFDDPVPTASGQVLGAKLASGVHVFRGIPYAAPPVGQLRWKEPQPVASWKGVRYATQYGNICVQTRSAPGAARDWGKDPLSPANMGDTTPESEDCLYLNIWTPAKAPGEKLPVMVWIYGGGFRNSSSSAPVYDGENFAKSGVVMVSFNYRGGVLGYLTHPELTKESPHHASGNYGNLDQIAALKWVQANIANFGGDPKNVTIFGESAGSSSVNLLQASPLAKGLFVRGIGESRTSIA